MDEEYFDPLEYIPMEFDTDPVAETVEGGMLPAFGVNETYLGYEWDFPFDWGISGDDPFFGTDFLDGANTYAGVVAADPRLNGGNVLGVTFDADGKIRDSSGRVVGTWKQPVAAASAASNALAALGNFLKSVLGSAKVSAGAGASGSGMSFGGSSQQQPQQQLQGKRSVGQQLLPDGRIATFWSDGTITYSGGTPGSGLDAGTGAVLVGAGLVGLALLLR